MQPVRVLMIEPDVELAEMVTEELSEQGVDVQWQADAQQGLEWLLNHRGARPDVVVLGMPPPLEELQWFLDGIKASERAASMPVIATVSVHRVPGTMVRRCAHFVWKPYSIESLVNAVELVLRRPIRRAELPR